MRELTMTRTQGGVGGGGRCVDGHQTSRAFVSVERIAGTQELGDLAHVNL